MQIYKWISKSGKDQVYRFLKLRSYPGEEALTYIYPGGGGTDLERGYGDVRPWRPPFHASPATCKGPISSKRVSSQDPLLRKFWNFSLYSLNYHPNFSSQAPKFGHFQLSTPKFGNFPLTSPPFSEENVSSQAPHFRNPGRTPLPEKKKCWVPPPGHLCAVILRQGPTDPTLNMDIFNVKLWPFITVIQKGYPFHWPTKIHTLFSHLWHTLPSLKID